MEWTYGYTSVSKVFNSFARDTLMQVENRKRNEINCMLYAYYTLEQNLTISINNNNNHHSNNIFSYRTDISFIVHDVWTTDTAEKAINNFRNIKQPKFCINTKWPPRQRELKIQIENGRMMGWGRCWIHFIWTNENARNRNSMHFFSCWWEVRLFRMTMCLCEMLMEIVWWFNDSHPIE